MTATHHSSNDNLVIFKVGPVPCCVDSQHVLAVIEPPAHITAIPGSNAFRPGLFSYQKRAVAVYDVRTKFSLSTKQRGKIMLTEINRQLFGFWVDQIQQIALASQGRMQILPAECPKELFESLFILNDQLIFKTSFEALSKAQVSTRTQQFIQQFVKEKTAQQQSTDEITTKTSSQTSLKTTKNDLPLSAETNAPKPATKPLEIDSVNTLKTSVSKAAETATKNPSFKTTSDNSLNHAVRTSEILTKSKTAIENRIKAPQATTTKNDINPEITSPVSARRKQVDLYQKSVSDNADKTKVKKTDFSKNSITKEHGKISPEINQRTRSNLENSQIDSSLNKTDILKGATVSSRDATTQIKHSFSTANKETAKKVQSRQQDEDSNSAWPIIFFIFILLLPIAYFAIAYFEWDLMQTSETKSAYRPLKQKQEDKLEAVIVTETKENNLENLPAETESFIATNIDTEALSDISSNSVIDNDLADQPNTSVINPDNVIEEISVETKLTETYQAEIEKHDNDITITLSGPDIELNTTESDTVSIELTETITKEESEITKTQSDPKEDLEENSDSDLSIELKITTTESNKEISPKEAQPASKKIIHVVVKGDTLWHIAKRYVRDPFKYNELARLSKIKNPDLIYPGNRVIIIIQNNNN